MNSHFKFYWFIYECGWGTFQKFVDWLWKVKVGQLCPTLSNLMDCSPPASKSMNSLGQNTGVDSHSLFQGIFPNQGLNPSLPHWRWILYCLSHQGDPGTPTDKPQMLSRQHIIHQSFHLIFHEHLWPTLLSPRGAQWSAKQMLWHLLLQWEIDFFNHINI